MAKGRAEAGARTDGPAGNPEAGDGVAPYPVFCCYCGVLTRRSVVENTSGMCRPCLERVWSAYVRRHPADARDSPETTGEGSRQD